MPHCELSDVTIYYELSGQGEPVLFFNGSGATLSSSALLIGALAKDNEVLAHDQRGLGKTSIPEGPYTMADYASDGARLLDHVGWIRCSVVGISFGGMVAQEFAVTWPDRVNKLVLMCTSAGGDAGSSYPLHELASLAPDARQQKMALLTDTRFTPEWLRDHPDDAQMLSMRAEQAALPKDKDVLRGERLQLQARIGHDVADRLHRISAPTLVTAGRYDGIAPVSNSEAIAARIPQAELKVYEGGHLFTAQDRQAMVDIREFLRGAR
jgi:pimeloyl-ACP methyl ester carboxylesterase